MEAFPAWYLLLVILGPFLVGGAVIAAGLFLWRRNRSLGKAMILLPILFFAVPWGIGWAQFELDVRRVQSVTILPESETLPRGSALVLHQSGQGCAGICEGLSYDQFTADKFALRQYADWAEVLSAPLDLNGPHYATVRVDPDDLYRREHRTDADLPDDLGYVLVTGSLEGIAPIVPQDVRAVLDRFEGGEVILLYAVQGDTLDVKSQQPVARMIKASKDYMAMPNLVLNSDTRYIRMGDGIDALFAAAKS